MSFHDAYHYKVCNLIPSRAALLYLPQSVPDDEYTIYLGALQEDTDGDAGNKDRLLPDMQKRTGMYQSPLIMQALIACFYSRGPLSEGARFPDFFNNDNDGLPRQLLALILSIVRILSLNLNLNFKLRGRNR